jgi:nitrite reductase/ring-hydroxylating ferredoxin subunit
VETAILAAAPEVTGIEVVEVPSAAAGPAVIPVSALRSRLDDGGSRLADGGSRLADGGADWTTVAGLGALAPGELGTFDVAGLRVVGARVGGELYAYRDRCPRCTSSLAGSAVERRLGGRAGDAVLRCPTCGGHYDVRHAGAGLDGTDDHLEPVPLLVTDGVVSVAVPRVVGA